MSDDDGRFERGRTTYQILKEIHVSELIEINFLLHLLLMQIGECEKKEAKLQNNISTINGNHIYTSETVESTP